MKPTIPIKQISKEFENGIVVGRIPPEILQGLEAETDLPHRHDSHFFALHEKGKIEMEIDFVKYKNSKPALLYMNPNQVHRSTKTDKNIVGYVLVITNENIQPEYLKLLEEITPAKPLRLNEKNFADIRQAMLLCINFFERKKDRLHHSLLKNSCNTLIALIISQYLETLEKPSKIARFDRVTKDFKKILERNFITSKRPADYANELHISVSYLNECVSRATGLSVSHHIRQRVILEAKRLLFHSEKSVKEIAAELGFDDYAYFSRLFSKNTGMTALSFRNKNRD